jgi:hypothetical protein
VGLRRIELILGFIPFFFAGAAMGVSLSLDVSRNGFPTWSNYLVERPGAAVALLCHGLVLVPNSFNSAN